MNILSLFDGISGARIACERAGIEIDKFYSSEIDKFAMYISDYNYPDNIQLGSVNDMDSWDLPNIDIIIAGSPCQSFSRCGNKLNFEDERGKLLWRCKQAIDQFEPKYFIFENVLMKQELQDNISELLGVQPIKINSSYFSAQNRVRLYWTNIDVDETYTDKGIKLCDIIESGYVDRDKCHCLDASYHKGGDINQYLNKSRRQIVFETDNKYRKVECKTNAMCKRIGTAINLKGHDYNKRIYDINGKSPTVNASSGGNLEIKIAIDDIYYRKLTPLECERLQTLPENYTECGIKNGNTIKMSNLRRYRTIGNGFTIDVIAHILRGIKNGINMD